jgi:hypothetical protein
MKTFAAFVAESPDNTSSMPSLFKDEYQRLVAGFKLAQKQVVKVDDFHGMKLHIAPDGDHLTRYFGIIGDRIVFYAALKIGFDEFVRLNEFAVETMHISKDDSVSPGVASAFFWKYHRRENGTSVSDAFLTKSGEAVWFKIIEEALRRGLFVGAINKDLRQIAGFDSVDDARKFSGKNKQDWQFFVSSSKTLRENYLNVSGWRYNT